MMAHQNGDDYNHWLRMKIFWSDAQRIFFFPILIIVSIVLFYRDQVISETAKGAANSIEELRHRQDVHETLPGHVSAWQEVGKLQEKIDALEKKMNQLHGQR